MHKKILPILAILLVSLSTSKTHADDRIVAATLILEAGGEKGYGHMEAVLEVIRNRSVKRNMSLKEVCLEDQQFAVWTNKNVKRETIRAMQHTRWREALFMVRNIQTNLTKGADHYHGDYIETPYWAKKLTKTIKIGKHIFYR